MKTCISCNSTKPESEFNKNRSRKDGLQSRCRICDRERALKLYRQDSFGKDKAYKRTRANIKKKREAVLNYLRNHPCKCGESDPVVLEFDHIDPANKDANVAELLASNVSLETIFREIEKCDVLCSNCHKKRTAKQFNWHKWVSSSVGRASP